MSPSAREFEIAGVASGTAIAISALLKHLAWRGCISTDEFALDIESGISEAERTSPFPAGAPRKDILMLRTMVSLLRQPLPTSTPARRLLRWRRLIGRMPQRFAATASRLFATIVANRLEHEGSPMVRTSLEDRPEYVNAIGLVTIEVTNLELALGQVLGALLGVGPDISNSIYFTPRAEIPRLEILGNVAALTLNSKSAEFRSVASIVSRAKAAIGKRHRVIHDAWVLSEDQSHVRRMSLPMKAVGSREAPLRELQDLIRDLRKLVGDTLQLTFKVSVVAKRSPWRGIHVGPTPPEAE
jgi:hypothetical protein